MQHINIFRISAIALSIGALSGCGMFTRSDFQAPEVNIPRQLATDQC
ncbi:MAG: hypothetical protein LRY40_00595 [Shewanella fodinae]|nr:hypothetical protein [Shewanella fodinae]